MSLSRHQNTGQNYDIKISNRWFENMAQFRYLGTTIANENLSQEEIKRGGIFLEGKWRPARKADNLAAICNPIL
jgi:hypothetical protein